MDDYKKRSRNFKNKQLAEPVYIVNGNDSYIVKSRKFKDKQLAEPIYDVSTGGGEGTGGDTIQSFTYDINNNKLTIKTDQKSFSASITELNGVILNGDTVIKGKLSLQNGNFYKIDNSDEEYQTLIQSFRSDGSFRSVLDDRYSGIQEGGVEIAIFDENNEQICALGATESIPYYDTKTGRLRLLTEKDLSNIQDQLDDLDSRVTYLEEKRIATKTELENTLKKQDEKIKELEDKINKLLSQKGE